VEQLFFIKRLQFPHAHLGKALRRSECQKLTKSHTMQHYTQLNFVSIADSK